MNSNESHEGILLHQGERRPVRLGWGRNTLFVFNNEEREDIPLSRLEIEVGGNQRSLIFFNFPDGRVIYLRKTKPVLNHLRAVESPHLNFVLSDNYAGLKNSILMLAVGAALVIGVIALLWNLKSPAASFIAHSIPFEYEKALGDRLLGVVLPSGQIVADEKIKEQLEKMLEPLKQQIQSDVQEVKFYISSSQDLNAFALPGGHVVFNVGLLKGADRPEEILGVAAHELAHVAKRHVLRNLIEGAGLFFIVQTLLGDLSGIAAVFADQGSFLLKQSFSRDFEREADEVGFKYLVAAQIDPLGMRDFFAKLLEKTNGTESEALSYFSTHPQTSERIKRIEQLYEALPRRKISELKPLSFDFNQFKLLLEK